MIATIRAQPVAWVGLGVVAAAIAIVIVGIPLRTQVDSGHASFHAIQALVFGAIPLIGLAIRPTPSRTTAIAWWGLEVLAIASLLEAIGGFGFGADGYDRNDLAVIHDLSLALTPLAMIVAVVGIAIGVGGAFMGPGASPGRRVVGALIGLGVLVALGAVLAMLVGLF